MSVALRTTQFPLPDVYEDLVSLVNHHVMAHKHMENHYNLIWSGLSQDLPATNIFINI